MIHLAFSRNTDPGVQGSVTGRQMEEVQQDRPPFQYLTAQGGKEVMAGTI